MIVLKDSTFFMKGCDSLRSRLTLADANCSPAWIIDMKFIINSPNYISK